MKATIDRGGFLIQPEPLFTLRPAGKVPMRVTRRNG